MARGDILSRSDEIIGLLLKFCGNKKNMTESQMLGVEEILRLQVKIRDSRPNDGHPDEMRNSRSLPDASSSPFDLAAATPRTQSSVNNPQQVTSQDSVTGSWFSAVEGQTAQPGTEMQNPFAPATQHSFHDQSGQVSQVAVPGSWPAGIDIQIAEPDEILPNRAAFAMECAFQRQLQQVATHRLDTVLPGTAQTGTMSQEHTLFSAQPSAGQYQGQAFQSGNPSGSGGGVNPRDPGYGAIGDGRFDKALSPAEEGDITNLTALSHEVGASGAEPSPISCMSDAASIIELPEQGGTGGEPTAFNAEGFNTREPLFGEIELPSLAESTWLEVSPPEMTSNQNSQGELTAHGEESRQSPDWSLASFLVLSEDIMVVEVFKVATRAFRAPS